MILKLGKEEKNRDTSRIEKGKSEQYSVVSVKGEGEIETSI